MDTLDRKLACLAALLLAGCAGIPPTRQWLPDSTSAATARLPAAGARAHVLTSSGEELDLRVDSIDGRLLVGTRDAGDPASVRLAADSVAVAYYRDPARSPGKAGLPPPDPSGLPLVRRVGGHESELSCARLQVELARGEALHGYLRRSGLQAYTAGEAAARHAGNAVKYTAITALVIVACSAGCGGGGWPSGDGKAAPSGQDYRWALTALDGHLERLLEAASAQGCAARPTLDPRQTDLGAWAAFTQWRAQAGNPAPTPRSVRDRRTQLLDGLGPRPVGAPG